MRFKFLKTILILTVLIALLMAWPLHAWISPEVARSVIVSGIISVCNVTLGVLALEYAFDKPTSLFMSIVFGSMALRSVVVIAVLFVLLLVGDYHRTSLGLSLMAFHVVFMTAEIIYILRDFSRRRLDDLIRSERQRRIRMSNERQRRLS